MSIELMTSAWKLDLSPTDKLVLLALADNANDEGVCWPSITTLCAKSCLSERAVQRSLCSLIDLRHIRRHERAGRSSYFTVTLGGATQSPTPATVAPHPRHTGTPGVPHSHPESSSEPSRNHKGTRLPLDWELSETRKAEAIKSGKDPDKEFEIFHDYWAAKPGRAGVRLDWDATWRNWCRRSFGKPVVADSGEWQIVRAAIKDSSLRATVLPVIRNKVGLIGGFNYLGSLKPYDLDQKRKEFEALR